MDLEHLLEQRPHNLFGQSTPLPDHPHRKVVSWERERETESPMFKFAPVAPSLVTGFHWQGLGSLIFILSLQVLIFTDKIHLSISSLGWKVLALTSFLAMKDPPSPCINFVVLHWICPGKSHSHQVSRLSAKETETWLHGLLAFWMGLNFSYCHEEKSWSLSGWNLCGFSKVLEVSLQFQGTSVILGWWNCYPFLLPIQCQGPTFKWAIAEAPN